MSRRRTLEAIMQTVSAEIIEVFIGPEERIYKMAVFLLGNTKHALFVRKDPSTNLWSAEALPKELEDPVFFNDFTLSLAEMGYVLKTQMHIKQ